MLWILQHFVTFDSPGSLQITKWNGKFTSTFVKEHPWVISNCSAAWCHYPGALKWEGWLGALCYAVLDRIGILDSILNCGIFWRPPLLIISKSTFLAVTGCSGRRMGICFAFQYSHSYISTSVLNSLFSQVQFCKFSSFWFLSWSMSQSIILANENGIEKP